MIEYFCFCLFLPPIKEQIFPERSGVNALLGSLKLILSAAFNGLNWCDKLMSARPIEIKCNILYF